MKGISSDARGQVSFAVVAVLILTLAGASALLASQSNMRAGDMEEKRSRLVDMGQCASSVAPEVEEEAYRAAIRACEGVPGLNGTLLDECFQATWNDYIGARYPIRIKGFEVDLVNSSLHLDFLRLAKDVVLGSFADTGELEWSAEGLPAYFALNGNFTVQVSEGDDRITSTRWVQRHLYLPLPLLFDRIDAFERSVTGGKSRLENLVRYELAALVQWRVLQGFGTSSMFGDQGTSSLLTEEDAARATNLALIMVELECFGTFDSSSASEVLSDFPAAIAPEELFDMVRGQDRFDPADLFLRMNGAGLLDVREVLAQALYSAVDLIALRWMDYLQIIDLAELMEGMATDALVTLNDILTMMTGDDNLMEQAMGWIKGRLKDAGYEEQDYRWMNYGALDATLVVPSRSFDVCGRDGESRTLWLEGYHGLDFPSLDVLSLECWKDFMVEFRKGSFELASLFQGFLRALAMTIADGSGLPALTLRLDPCDDLALLDEVGGAITRALAEKDEWFDDAIREAHGNLDLKDPLGEALTNFVQEEWRDIFQMNSSVESALDKLACEMVQEELGGWEGFDEDLIRAYSQMLAYEMKNDASWELRQEVEQAFSVRSLKRVDIFSEAFSNITLRGLPGSLGTMLVGLAQGLIDNVPGIRATLTEACRRMLEDACLASDLRNDRTWVVPTSERVVLSLGGAILTHEHLVPIMDLPETLGHSGLDLQVQIPRQSEAGANGQNLHMTDPGNFTLAAYQSTFRVMVRGGVQVSLQCHGDLSDLLRPSSEIRVTRNLLLGFDSALTCASAWPLQGVRYTPTSTLLGDLGKVFGRIWEAVTMAFDWLAKAADRLFSLLQDLLSTLVSYSIQIIQAISDFLMSIVQGVRDLVDGLVGALIGWIGEALAGKVGKTDFTLGFGGLLFLFEFAPTDIFLGRSKEYMRVTMRTDLLGAQLVVQARFVDIYRKGPDLIANISLASGDWRAECVIDPRMMVMDHFIELRGAFKDFMLDLAMPVVIAFEKRSFRLSDIPGLGQVLSRIPVPIPGLTASIDAGFEIKYNSPITTHLVINEVELNPAGSDQGREWVELYNPSNSPVDLTDWTLRTAHGSQGISTLEDAMMGPKSHLVIGFPGQTLDNGGESGYPLGESVALIDSTGRKVDSTPYLSDHYNDGRTWQRSFDASEQWEFKDASRNGPNGFMMIDLNNMERWQRSLMDAVARAFARMGDVVFDLDSLAEMIKAAIIEVVDTIVQTLARSIVEMSIFVELALQDYSQSFDGRLRLALAVTGEGVRDALLWIADSLRSALSELINPAAVAPRARSIHEILDDVYVRFGAFGSMGLPRLLSMATGEKRFSFGANIELNLATLIAPPKGPRNWTVNFGALFQEVPGAYLRSLYPVDADKLVDCWVLRASMHSIRSMEQAALDVWS